MRLFRLRSRSLSITAALVLLIGTATPALARMTCVIGGHTVLSVGQARECCPEDHGHRTTTVKATCCELVQAQPQRTAFLPGHGPELLVVEAMASLLLPPTALSVVPGKWSQALRSRPPPIDGLHRLAVLSTFLI